MGYADEQYEKARAQREELRRNDPRQPDRLAFEAMHRAGMVGKNLTPKEIKIGGLLRCCIDSLKQFMQEPDYKDEEGATHKCRYCKSGKMIVKDGFWQWDKEHD